MFEFRRNSRFRSITHVDESGKKTSFREKLPMRKGLALVRAREILGPSAHVQRRGADLVILNHVGGVCIAYGHTWEEAIKSLRDRENQKNSLVGMKAAPQPEERTA